MIVRATPSTWLIEQEHRFDCGPFTRGGIEARKHIEGLSCEKDRLVDVTLGGLEGIYHVGQEKIRWVESPEYGIPFLRSTDILRADLSNTTLISRSQVARNPLFQCPEGTTLITRSGSIGRMAYCRKEMAEMAISQDVLKVVPNPSAIPPGYLYAFLSSRFGIPQVVAGQFGAIIVHIEAENIMNLPVPRLGEKIEHQVHDLVQQAAEKRSEAMHLFHLADEWLHSVVLKTPQDGGQLPASSPSVTSISSSQAQSRLDAFYYEASNLTARAILDAAGKAHGSSRLDDVSDVFIPGIFKRRYASDPAFGVPYLTGATVYTLSPSSDQYLLHAVADQYRLRVKDGMILIQDSGQLSGLIGRPVCVGKALDGFACTNNMVRVEPHDPDDAGYIFAVLASEEGVRLLKREASGTSIPHLESKRIGSIEIPWPSETIRKDIGKHVAQAISLRDEAFYDEREGIELIETEIDRMGAD